MEVISSIYNSGYNIKKFYLGSRELNLAYLGNQVIYDEVIGDNDLNYILYEFYGSDTLPNTVEAPVKSAILKGRTLINLFDINSISNAPNGSGNQNINDWVVFKNNGGANSQTFYYNTIRQDIEIGKKYIAFLYVGENTIGDVTVKGAHAGYYLYPMSFNVSSPGVYKTTFIANTTATDRKGNINFRCITSSSNVGEFKFRILLLKDEDVIGNQDFAYFEGMESVRMPVLRTSNNDCYIINIEKNCYYTAGAGKFTYSANFDTYNVYVHGLSAVKLTSDTELSDMSFWGDNNQYISGGGSFQYTFSVPSNAKYFKVAIQHGNTSLTVNGFDIINDYKSNILSTPSDLELRGIGDVQDTLDCLTGEKVERIGEIVLDGSEDEDWRDWWHLTNTVGCYIPNGIPNNGKVVVNNIPYNTINGGDESNDIEGYNLSTAGTLLVRILKSKLSSPDLNGFKEYLASNPIVIQYGLTQESIKTVALSDNHVYSYKGTTHYSCSSEEGSLIPTLSVKVPTDTQLTIQEQKATTQTLLIKNMDLQQSIKEVQAMNLAFNTALYNSFNSIGEEVEDIKKHVSTNENLEGSF